VFMLFCMVSIVINACFKRFSSTQCFGSGRDKHISGADDKTSSLARS